MEEVSCEAAGCDWQDDSADSDKEDNSGMHTLAASAAAFFQRQAVDPAHSSPHSRGDERVDISSGAGGSWLQRNELIRTDRENPKKEPCKAKCCDPGTRLVRRGEKPTSGAPAVDETEEEAADRATSEEITPDHSYVRLYKRDAPAHTV